MTRRPTFDSYKLILIWLMMRAQISAILYSLRVIISSTSPAIPCKKHCRLGKAQIFSKSCSRSWSSSNSSINAVRTWLMASKHCCFTFSGPSWFKSLKFGRVHFYRFSRCWSRHYVRINPTSESIAPTCNCLLWLSHREIPVTNEIYDWISSKDCSA